LSRAKPSTIPRCQEFFLEVVRMKLAVPKIIKERYRNLKAAEKLRVYKKT
jgi:hypothetical protein